MRNGSGKFGGRDYGTTFVLCVRDILDNKLKTDAVGEQQLEQMQLGCSLVRPRDTSAHQMQRPYPHKVVSGKSE